MRPPSDLPAYCFTIIENRSGGLAAKTITLKADGTFKKSDYDNGYMWRFEARVADTHVAMAAVLRALATRPKCAIILGRLLPHLDPSKTHRRKTVDDDERTLYAPDLAWLAIDTDDFPVPSPLGRADKLEECGRHIRDTALPAEFKGCRCIVAPSASTGLKGDGLARLRFFFLIDREVAIAELYRWAKAARALGYPLDPRVMLAGQPIYTARPAFVGMVDPVPADMHAIVLDGDRERVTLDLHAFDDKFEAIERTIKAAVAGSGGDWRKVLEITLGSDLGFYEPLARALGMASLTAESAETITAHIVALLAERADPERRRRYSAAWIKRELTAFRRKNANREARIAAARARLIIPTNRKD